MKKKNYLTQEGLKKLKKELAYLKNIKRKEIAQRLKKAISFGDLSENAAYVEAKDAQAFLEGKILELRKIIGSAEIIKKEKSDKVKIGSIVRVMFEGQEFNFEIVGELEANPLDNKISYKSPLGSALFGQKKGKEININIGDRKIKYKILNID